MRRVWFSMVLWMVLGSTVQAAERVQELREVDTEAVNGASFTFPMAYGHLVDVVAASEIHYLYFQDEAGTVRVVLMGQRGAVQRARNPLELLSPDVYVIKRGAAKPAAGS